MIIDDSIIIEKTNNGKIKKMNIYGAIHLLTLEEIGRLIKGKKIRKGHYLYYVEKFKIDYDEINEIDPFGDLRDEEDIEGDFLKNLEDDLEKIKQELENEGEN